MIKARTAQISEWMLDVAAAFAALATALFLAELLHSFFGVTRLAVLFLAAVTVTASVRGARAAIAAAVLGMLFYKLFLDLRTPEHTDVAEDVLTLSVFLVVALITGALAGRLHDEAAASRVRAERMEALFGASRTMSDGDEAALWKTLAGTLSRASGGVAFAIDRNGTVQAQSGGSESDAASAVELAKTLLASAAAADSDSKWQARLIAAQTEPLGVLVWDAEGSDAELEGVVSLLGEIASASLVRSQARQKQIRLKAEEEANRLREALLSSISHDFRSPLAAIIGSSTSLLEYGEKFDASVTRDLLLNIQDEGEKLNQFVVNLLNMTRLESGVIKPAIQQIGAADVIAGAIERLGRHRIHALKVDVEGDCKVMADPLLLEQALYNVLDNAVKYGGPEGVAVRCRSSNKQCQIVIADQGPGLSQQDQEAVFTKFHFARTGTGTSGTGLGLSISRGFVEAMGGTIDARNRSDGRAGLEVAITLSEPA